MTNVNKPVLIVRNNMGATQVKHVKRIKEDYTNSLTSKQIESGKYALEVYNIDDYTNPLHFIQDMFTRDVDLHIPHQLRKPVRKEYNSRLYVVCRLIFY